MTEPWVTQHLDGWRDKFRALGRDANPPGVDLRRWRRFLNDCAIFLKSEPAEWAIELGWDEYELFGTDSGKAPLARYDSLGVLWLVQGETILAVSEDSITMTSGSQPLRCYRKIALDPMFIRLPWDPLPEAPENAPGRPQDEGKALGGTREPQEL